MTTFLRLCLSCSIEFGETVQQWRTILISNDKFLVVFIFMTVEGKGTTWQQWTIIYKNKYLVLMNEYRAQHARKVCVC